MNEQDIFDTVVRNLAAQGHKSSVMTVTEDGFGRFESCQYRGPRGLKCAVGGLITDEEYTAEMEGKTIVALISAHQLPKRLRPFADLLGRLQVAHDTATDGYSLRDRLLEVARTFNLSADAVYGATFPTEWKAAGRE